jgi:hypothetical protein
MRLMTQCTSAAAADTHAAAGPVLVSSLTGCTVEANAVLCVRTPRSFWQCIGVNGWPYWVFSGAAATCRVVLQCPVFVGVCLCCCCDAFSALQAALKAVSECPMCACV